MEGNWILSNFTTISSQTNCISHNSILASSSYTTCATPFSPPCSGSCGCSSATIGTWRWAADDMQARGQVEDVYTFIPCHAISSVETEWYNQEVGCGGHHSFTGGDRNKKATWVYLHALPTMTVNTRIRKQVQDYLTLNERWPMLSRDASSISDEAGDEWYASKLWITDGRHIYNSIVSTRSTASGPWMLECHRNQDDKKQNQFGFVRFVGWANANLIDTALERFALSRGYGDWMKSGLHS